MADPAPGLPLLALRYAAGELASPAREEFEARLAHDSDAQDALAEAIRLSAAAIGQPLPTPHPTFRQVVYERLRPGLFTRVFPRRPYRGHPAAWASLGGALAAGLTVLGVWIGENQEQRVAILQVHPPIVEPAAVPQPPLAIAPLPRAAHPASTPQVASDAAPQPSVEPEPPKVSAPKNQTQLARRTEPASEEVSPPVVEVIPTELPPGRGVSGETDPKGVSRPSAPIAPHEPKTLLMPDDSWNG